MEDDTSCATVWSDYGHKTVAVDNPVQFGEVSSCMGIGQDFQILEPATSRSPAEGDIDHKTLFVLRLHKKQHGLNIVWFKYNSKHDMSLFVETGDRMVFSIVFVKLVKKLRTKTLAISNVTLR